MSRRPFDLSFDDLVSAGARASKAAVEGAERAGVPIATLAEPAQAGPRGSSWTGGRFLGADDGV